MFKCEFCEKELSSRGSLKTHQERTKYCLDLQLSISEPKKSMNNMCQFCNKSFQSKQWVIKHENSCTHKIVHDKLETQKKIYETIISEQKIIIISNEEKKTELEIQMKKYEDSISSLKEEITNLKIEHGKSDQKAEIYTSLYNKDQEHILKLSEKTGTTTNIKAKNIVMNALNLNLSAEKLEALKPTYTMAHYEAGGRGQAEWVVPHMLTDENGNSLYKCSDRNRKNFFYNNSEGEYISDTHAAKLKEAIRPIIESKLKEYKRTKCSELMDIEDENESNAAMEKMNSLFKENKSLGAEFDKRLVELTYG